MIGIYSQLGNISKGINSLEFNTPSYCSCVITCRSLLDRFAEQLLIRWSQFCAEYEPELRGGVDGHPAGVFPLPAVDVAAAAASATDEGTQAACKRWAHMKARVVEHVCLLCITWAFYTLFHSFYRFFQIFLD